MKIKQLFKTAALLLCGVLVFAAGCSEGSHNTGTGNPNGGGQTEIPGGETPGGDNPGGDTEEPPADPPRYDFTLFKQALELTVGQSEFIDAEDVVWTSDNEKVATVTQSGVIRGAGVGKTYVRATRGEEQSTVTVYVVEKKKSFEDNILISVFWPPTAEYMNGGVGDERWDEQFKLLADAHVDYLCNVTGRDRQQNIDPALVGENSKATNLKMAEFAYKYGMRVSVADERFNSFPNMDGADVYNIVSEYRNVPGVGGYYIKDEPADALPYLEIYEEMKQADPNGYAHLNFLPVTWYYAPAGGGLPYMEALERYREVIGDWLQANEDSGFKQDYAMFDLYPFSPNYELDRATFFTNLNIMREVGLEKDVKTAMYLQSCRGILQATGDVGYCRPRPEQIRYEAMVALAFGYKQLSYFTWFQPTNRNGEWFEDSIILQDGTPNPETYDEIALLNFEIHNLGKTLIRLDASEVYMNGEQFGGVSAVRGDFPFIPADNTKYTVSLMKDKTTGRNYMMFVNNDFNSPVDITGSLQSGITELDYVRNSDGELEAYRGFSDGRVTIHLEAGNGILLALPEGMNFVK